MLKHEASVALACKETLEVARKVNSGGASIEIVGMGSASRNALNSYSVLEEPKKLETFSRKTKVLPPFNSDLSFATSVFPCGISPAVIW